MGQKRTRELGISLAIRAVSFSERIPPSSTDPLMIRVEDFMLRKISSKVSVSSDELTGAYSNPGSI